LFPTPSAGSQSAQPIRYCAVGLTSGATALVSFKDGSVFFVIYACGLALLPPQPTTSTPGSANADAPKCRDCLRLNRVGGDGNPPCRNEASVFVLRADSAKFYSPNDPQTPATASLALHRTGASRARLSSQLLPRRFMAPTSTPASQTPAVPDIAERPDARIPTPPQQIAKAYDRKRASSPTLRIHRIQKPISFEK